MGIAITSIPISTRRPQQKIRKKRKISFTVAVVVVAKWWAPPRHLCQNDHHMTTASDQCKSRFFFFFFFFFLLLRPSIVNYCDDGYCTSCACPSSSHFSKEVSQHLRQRCSSSHFVCCFVSGSAGVESFKNFLLLPSFPPSFLSFRSESSHPKKERKKEARVVDVAVFARSFFIAVINSTGDLLYKPNACLHTSELPD